jgi:hypothetical protein
MPVDFCSKTILTEYVSFPYPENAVNKKYIKYVELFGFNRADGFRSSSVFMERVLAFPVSILSSGETDVACLR